MLSRTSSILCGIMLCLSVSAQQRSDNRFMLMVNAGITGCQVHGDSFDGYNKLGGMAGVGVSTAFSDKWSSSIGIQFIQKGAKHNPNPSKDDYKSYNLTLNYVEVPLLVTYRYKKLLLDLGVSAGYLAKYKEVTENGDITGYHPFRNMEYSVKGGIGYQITERLSAQLLSSNSFVTIRPYQTASHVYYSNFVARMFNKGLYNNILEIGLYYKFKPNAKRAD